MYNLRQHASRLLAEGSNLLWSPEGHWISYRGRHGEAVLIDPSGKKSQSILVGQKISHALHWSPDGRYLLLTLVSGNDILQWAHLMIYRMSDGALTPIGDLGQGSLDDSGREWVVTGPRR